MKDMLLAVGVLLVVGVLASAAASFFNRNIIFIGKEAKKFAQNRIRKRASEKPSIKELIDTCSSGEIDREKVKRIVESLFLALGLQLNEDRLSADDVLKNLCMVERGDLKKFDKAWRKAGLQESIEPFSQGMLELLNNLIQGDDRKKFLQSLSIDNKDDEILDAVMSMNVGSFVKVIVPYV